MAVGLLADEHNTNETTSRVDGWRRFAHAFLVPFFGFHELRRPYSMSPPTTHAASWCQSSRAGYQGAGAHARWARLQCEARRWPSSCHAPRALTSPRHGPDGGAPPEGREHSFGGAAVGQPQPRATRSLLPASLCPGCNERVLGWEREGRLCQTASRPVRLHGYSPKPTASLTEEETEQGFLQHQSSKQLAGWHEGD